MRRFLIEPAALKDSRPRLTGDQARHAINVLRLKPGSRVFLIDGQGAEYEAEITSVKAGSGGYVELTIVGESPPMPEPPLELTIGLGMLKADKMDTVVSKTTELGLKTLAPLNTERSTLRLDKKAEKKRLDRWRTISLEALKQCRRSLPVEIKPVMNLAEFCELSSRADKKILLYENARGNEYDIQLKISEPEKPRTVFALIGPEGGFTEGEVNMAKNAGFAVAGLGPRILRSETTTIALTSILGYVWGDLLKNVTF